MGGLCWAHFDGQTCWMQIAVDLFAALRQLISGIRDWAIRNKFVFAEGRN